MMLKDQDVLGTEEAVKKFLLMVPDEQLRNKAEKAMLNIEGSEKRWRVFEDLTTSNNNSKKVQKFHILFIQCMPFQLFPCFN